MGIFHYIVLYVELRVNLMMLTIADVIVIGSGLSFARISVYSIKIGCKFNVELAFRCYVLNMTVLFLHETTTTVVLFAFEFWMVLFDFSLMPSFYGLTISTIAKSLNECERLIIGKMVS